MATRFDKKVEDNLSIISGYEENNINYEKMKINNKTSLNELIKLIKLKN